MAETSVIDRLVAEHDKNPAQAAHELKELDPTSVDPKSVASYSWLLNHVLGELEGSWVDAFERQQALWKADAAAVVHFNYAVAAFHAGQPLKAWAAESRFAALTEATKAEAELVIRLGVLQHSAKGAESGAYFQAVLSDSLAQLKGTKISEGVVKRLGALLNNIVSSWLETPANASASVNPLMEEAAEASYTLWETHGTWVNLERAWYLRALVASHLSHWELGRDASLAGIQVIDANGEEDVDKAFFFVELARAYKGLKEPENQAEAKKKADAIAKEFSEPGLDEWYNDKTAGL